jgi:hypothetical protein
MTAKRAVLYSTLFNIRLFSLLFLPLLLPLLLLLPPILHLQPTFIFTFVLFHVFLHFFFFIFLSLSPHGYPGAMEGAGEERKLQTYHIQCSER